MNEDNEVYVAHEEQDSERLERILRHSSRRKDAPMMLVQLADPNPPPEFPLRQRVTIVNMAGTSPVVLGEKMDPFEWHFRKNTPDLRTTLVREESFDHLTSRRKSRIGGNPMEQLDFIVNTQTINNQSLYYEKEETGDNEGDISKATETGYQYEMEKEDPEALQENCLQKHQSNDLKMYLKTNEDGGEQFYEIERSNGEQFPIIDSIMKSLANYNKETVVMPAENSNKGPKSPFEKERDERSRRPSSRVRVFLMVDEWDEDDSIEDERRRKRQAKGDGRRGRGKYRLGEIGSLDSFDPYNDETRSDYVSDKSPFRDKRKDKSGRGRSDDEDDFGRYNGGEASKRGRKPGYRDKDEDGRGKDKRGRRLGDQDYDGRKPGYGDDERSERGKDKRGRRPGDEDYDGRKPGYGDDERSERGKDRRGRRPGDQDYDGRKPGYGDDERRERGKDRRGRRPGDEDYDGRKPDYGYDERGERGKDKRGRRPGDQDYDERKYGDETRTLGRDDKGYDDDKRDRKGRGEKGKRGKAKPGGDHDLTKYRLVTIPKSATTLTTRRRYHLQITDHNIKEPWFNSCFNIGKENNVDLNYEGPVKITPYYIGDKYT